MIGAVVGAFVGEHVGARLADQLVVVADDRAGDAPGEPLAQGAHVGVVGARLLVERAVSAASGAPRHAYAASVSVARRAASIQVTSR